MKQDLQFKHLVLMLLWAILLVCLGKRAHNQITNCRSSCVAFGDQFGTKGEEAKQYRREVTYWFPD